MAQVVQGEVTLTLSWEEAAALRSFLADRQDTLQFPAELDELTEVLLAL